MSTFDDLQVDFSGGEIGARMIMREETDVHAKSLFEMLNFIPTPQGTAVRTPGTKFIKNIGTVAAKEAARIIPYALPNGSRALIVMTPKVGSVNGDIEVLVNIGGAANAPTTTLTYDYVVPNGNLDAGFDNFIASPYEYVDNQGARLGWIESQGWLNLALKRGHHVDNPLLSGIISGPFQVPEVTNQIIVAPKFFYNSNSGNTDYGITVEIRIGTTLNGSDIATIAVPRLSIGGAPYTAQTVVSKAGDFQTGTNYYITIHCAADTGSGNDGDARTQPEFVVTDINVLAPKTTLIGEIILSQVVPYDANEIKDVHYVQSPYISHLDPAAPNVGVGKELVMTHPAYPPKRLYLKAATYTFEDIFTDDASQHYSQWNWGTNGYPATCGSFVGRLVLAGSTVGSSTASNGSSSETVWMTKVGDWGYFNPAPVPAPNTLPVLPSDSISFSTIYNTPIQWVAGQKELLIGAAEVEYTASADGIFAPADIGVAMHSTHGSNRVQPITMGSFIYFPAEGGTKMRAMQYASQQEGWVAPDMTLAHPSILVQGIQRMGRMRNPQQMAVVLLKSGKLALFSVDTDSGLSGWSRITLSGNAFDIAVVPDSSGVDILYMVVRRTVGGVNSLYLEAITGWTEKNEYGHFYLQAYVTDIAITPSNVVTGLDHLEGRYVQVITDSVNFQGTYLVTGGSITLVNQIGEPITYVSIVVGLAYSCSMTTLPLITSDPGGNRRYTNITVRTLLSSRPIINGERVADRDPLINMGRSQGLDIFYDNTVMEYGEHGVVQVSENLPYRLEVIGIFGTVKESSI